MDKKLKGRIVDISRNTESIGYLEQGIKKKDQYEYDNNPRVYGSNGSYITGFDYLGTSIDMRVYIFDLDKCITRDIRDYILKQNNMKKVSDKLFKQIKKDNEGKKIDIILSGDKVYIDMSQIDVKKKY